MFKCEGLDKQRSNSRENWTIGRNGRAKMLQFTCWFLNPYLTGTADELQPNVGRILVHDG